MQMDELSALQQPTADKLEEAENKVENARTELESAQQKADNDIEGARLDLDTVRAGVSFTRKLNCNSFRSSAPN